MKRILAILLTVCMVVWMIPATAFAENNKIELSNSNCEISVADGYYLSTDITNGQVTENRTITVKYVAGETATTLIENTDYTVSKTLQDNGKVRVEITPAANSNYVNSVFKDFDVVKMFDGNFFISQNDVRTASDTDKIKDQEYTGNEIIPKPLYLYEKDGNETKLIDSTNYTVTTNNAVNSGSVAKVIFEGKGQYRGRVEKEFCIVSKPIDPSILVSLRLQ